MIRSNKKSHFSEKMKFVNFDETTYRINRFYAKMKMKKENMKKNHLWIESLQFFAFVSQKSVFFNKMISRLDRKFTTFFRNKRKKVFFSIK